MHDVRKGARLYFSQVTFQLSQYHLLKSLFSSPLNCLCTFVNLIKNTYKKPTAHITFNGEKPEAFPLISGTAQGCPISPFFSTLYQKFQLLYQEKEIRNIQTKKEEIKTLHTWHDCSGRNLIASANNFLELTGEHNKVVG